MFKGVDVKVVGIRLPVDFVEELDEYADNNGMSRSEMVRRALREFAVKRFFISNP